MGNVPVTVVVAARNERANMPKCLRSLSPAARIVVLDSHSIDGTAECASELGAEVVQFHYHGTYPKKRQWLLDSGRIVTPWVLLIDADEEVTPGLWAEIADVTASSQAHDAYMITKSFHFLGQRFRFGGFSFAAVLLFKRGAARFEETLAESASDLDMEVHERMIVSGTVGSLRNVVLHNDFKGLTAYIDRHNRYSIWEAELRSRILEHGHSGEVEIKPRWFGNSQEFRRALKMLAIRTPFEPSLWWTYHMILRLGLLEGRRGLIAARMRANYIRDVRDKMYERRIRRRVEAAAPSPRGDASPTSPTVPTDTTNFSDPAEP
jgi:glycosyltransferase involved in cell wall biosynthesis